VPAILFDVFGTIITSEADDKTHRDISKELSKIHEQTFPPEEHFILYKKYLEEWLDPRRPSMIAMWKGLQELSSKYGFEIKVTPEDLDLMHKKYHRIHAELYPDAVEAVTLAKEKVGRLGIVSDSDEGIPKIVLEASGLIKFFDVIICSGEILSRKPELKMFMEAAKALSVEPQESVVIGDSWRDVVGAKNAGMKGVLLVRNRSKLPIEAFEAAEAIAISLLDGVNKALKILGL